MYAVSQRVPVRRHPMCHQRVPTYAGFDNGDPLRLAYLPMRSVCPRKPIQYGWIR